MPFSDYYAAANAFLDAFALSRRQRGLPVTSLAWGLWADPSAMTGALSGADRSRVARGGLLPMPTDEALQLFDAAVTADEPVLAPAQLDLRRTTDVPALLRQIAPQRTEKEPNPPQCGKTSPTN